MTYSKRRQDIFELDPTQWTFAHCVSADFVMGGGIAVPFKEKFNLYSLQKTEGIVGEARFLNGVYNLVTKKHVWDKPTYDNLGLSLLSMADDIKVKNIKKLAMPKIGCGLDQLIWDRVEPIIKTALDFATPDLHVLVCTIDE
jgi:O-acetyl-ADP-ribose deacetylase (regulator of RNase III)